MLVDELYINLKAGDGGNGAVSFFPGLKSGPDGGNGGDGGNIYVRAVTGLTGLNRYAQKRKIAAGNGGHGQGFRREGKGAPDLELEFPVGTTLIDQESRRVYELTEEGQRFMVARGGRGGFGNDHFKTSTNRAPRQFTPGQEGQEKHYKVILKLIADFGLIGLPNAGKSSLLNELTAAHVKTANYPFTTLEPNLGAIHHKVIADIPGLIEGASEGKGLGIKFLKHVEKVALLLHCVSAESDDVKRDYLTVRKELEQYNPGMLEKQEIVLLTKLDMVDAKQLTKKKKILEKLNPEVLTVSKHDWDSLEALKKKLLK